MPDTEHPRVIPLAPMPPEKVAYALARYSRSADSIRESLEWVRTHDSQKFLESFYFQYGHASIADLGHLAVCFEGISELVATEIEDEQLWDGQAKSTRYQDFSKVGIVVPPDLNEAQRELYLAAGRRLLAAYEELHAGALAHLKAKLPRPDEMKEGAYERNLAARAFDVARYLLFLGIPTNIGQVTSIRTLERQIRRMKASRYAELREVGEEAGTACASREVCPLAPGDPVEPVAPTLAKYVDADLFEPASRQALAAWAEANLPKEAARFTGHVDLLKPQQGLADIVATLLYPVSGLPFRRLYELAVSWPQAKQREVVATALESRGRFDELPRAFRNAPYVFDIVMDIGAYRDLHRHRRCQQLRQSYADVLNENGSLGFETPPLLEEAGLADRYRQAIAEALGAARQLPSPACDYLLPFGCRARFLFRMDFAEAEYIAKLRSGVKGHFSYRDIAWKMREKMRELEPVLGEWMDATPPEVEDPLTR
ncbi:MAG: FAD-dependent thymidylate synthase [Bryobacterales bacterium]|nr:FAD-dependent thymidylate synthase [Bryobacterales bacterium]